MQLPRNIKCIFYANFPLEFKWGDNVMLRIEKEEYINKTFRLDTRLVNEMDNVCNQKGISMNKLVDICIRYALDNLEEAEEKQ